MWKVRKLEKDKVLMDQEKGRVDIVVIRLKGEIIRLSGEIDKY